MPTMTKQLRFWQVGAIMFGFDPSNKEALTNLGVYIENLDSEKELTASMLRQLKIGHRRFEETLDSHAVVTSYCNGASILISATVNKPLYTGADQGKTEWVWIQKDQHPVHSSKKWFYSYPDLFEVLVDGNIILCQPGYGVQLRFFIGS